MLSAAEMSQLLYPGLRDSILEAIFNRDKIRHSSNSSELWDLIPIVFNRDEIGDELVVMKRDGLLIFDDSDSSLKLTPAGILAAKTDRLVDLCMAVG